MYLPGQEDDMDRRTFLQSSVALGGTLLLEPGANAAPAPIDAPIVDRVVFQEFTDGAHDIFLRGVELPGLAVNRTGYNQIQGRTLHSEWGLALRLESQRKSIHVHGLKQGALDWQRPYNWRDVQSRVTSDR
jgi:hypothetical protein